MRNYAKSGPLSVHAIAGAYVVMLGIDMEQAATEGVLGFAIMRTEHGHRGGEMWLKSLRVFPDVPVEPVLSLSEARAHPQVAARGVVHRAADGLPRLGFPARFDDARPRAAELVPDLGAHTASVLAEHDLDAGRSTRELREAGIGPRRSTSSRLRRLWLRLRRR